MKLIILFLIASVCLTFQPLALAQTQSVYKAELLVSDGKKISAEPVEIFLENDQIKIQGKKKSFETKLILFTAIESVDYTYSERPRYTAATLATLALGVTGLFVFFTKTKKNWLTVNAGKTSVILQLQSSNYRMLLLALRSKGIKISDSGNRDENEKNARENREKDKKLKKN